MLEINKEKVGRIVPARLTISIKGNPDLFGQDSDEVVRTRKAYRDAQDKMEADRKRCILKAFRSVVKEYVKQFPDEYPTKIYMSSQDVSYLVEAYNEESKSVKNQDGTIRERISEWDSDLIEMGYPIDGIRIKKGCDRNGGELNIHCIA